MAPILVTVTLTAAYIAAYFALLDPAFATLPVIDASGRHVHIRRYRFQHPLCRKVFMPIELADNALRPGYWVCNF